MEYTSYERVKTALEHQEADRIPFDLGASGVTGINKHAYARLRQYLELPEKESELFDVISQIAKVDNDIMDRLHVDVKPVTPAPSSKKGLTKEVTRNGDYYMLTDEWGSIWRMPVDGGHYFDLLEGALKDATTAEDIEKFPWPDLLDDVRYITLKQQADTCVYQEQKAYMLGKIGGGALELALRMNGYEKFFIDMASNKTYVHALMEKITELRMQYWNKALDAVGDNVLIVTEADDLASQHGLLFSPGMYKQLIHPYHKTLFTFIKKKAEAQTGSKVYLFYHTCGAVKPLIPLLIEEGIDILNPVQVNAKGMDTKELKQEFGNDLTFWGGGIDTQQLLPFGTPEQVRDEVKRRIDDLAPGGGFVFTAVHNVQSDVPMENFMAMWETLQEYGKY